MSLLECAQALIQSLADLNAAVASPPLWGRQFKETYIESCINGRFLFETSDSGDITSIRGNEGGWASLYNKPVVTADTDYYDRDCWKVTV